MPFYTIDLCAGIGGIRRGFELTGHFKNRMAAEIDPFACMTYKHLSIRKIRTPLGTVLAGLSVAPM